jgi:hypothetical protein
MSFKVFPSNHEKLIFIAVISFCLGVVVGLLPGLDVKTIAGAIATLVAAFSGAFFAYKFNSDREKQRKEDVDLISANKAIFTIIRVYNHIAGFNKQFLKPFANNSAAYVAIRPSLGNENPDWKLDYDSILFLIAENKPEILIELAELEELFIIFTKILNDRNQMHVNIVQPALESAGITDGGSTSVSEVDSFLGEKTSATMKNLTSELIAITQHGEELSDQLIQKLHKTMVDIFPGKNVVRMEKLNK